MVEVPGPKVAHLAVEAPLVARAEETRALGAMTCRLAHDLNNLVMALYGHTELASRCAGAPDELDAHLDGINAGAARVADLAGHLSSLGRRANSDAQPVDFFAIAKVAIQRVQDQAQSGVGFDAQGPSEAFLVFGDLNEVYQMVIHLCKNAVEALSDSGGLVELRWNAVQVNEDALEGPRADGWQARAGEYAHFSVRDTGQGIHLDSLEKIFEPFFSTKGATGLGLTLVARVVRSMGGFVNLTTMLGEGSTFSVFLPLHDSMGA